MLNEEKKNSQNVSCLLLTKNYSTRSLCQEDVSQQLAAKERQKERKIIDLRFISCEILVHRTNILRKLKMLLHDETYIYHGCHSCVYLIVQDTQFKKIRNEANMKRIECRENNKQNVKFWELIYLLHIPFLLLLCTIKRFKMRRVKRLFLFIRF